MKLYGIVCENENGDFEPVSGFGSSTVGDVRIFATIDKAERSIRQLRNRPHLKDKTLLIGTFELQGATEDINELKIIEEREQQDEL